MTGDFAAVENYHVEVERIGTAAGSDNALLLAAVQRWWLLTYQGRAIEALATVERALALSPVPPIGGQVSHALALASADRIEEAKAILDRLLPDQLELAPVDSEWLAMLCEAALAVQRVGGHPEAKWLYENLLPHRDLYVVEGIGACCLGSVETFLAMVAPASAAHAARARSANQGVGLVTAPISEPEATLRPQGDTWVVGWSGDHTPVRDRKGLHDIAALVQRPRQPIHVLDLVGGGEVGARGTPRLDADAVGRIAAALPTSRTRSTMPTSAPTRSGPRHWRRRSRCCWTNCEGPTVSGDAPGRSVAPTPSGRVQR